MIPTHNCGSYLAKTIGSVLEQDLGDQFMQIEVIDDCSKDNVEEIVSQFGKGRVSLYRQISNVGHVKNFESAINRAKGKFVHLLHGDDFVLPGFYQAMTLMYETFPEIGACYCRHFFVDEEDNITAISELREKQNTVFVNFHKTLIHGQKIQTPSITVKKDIYSKLGYFNPGLSWTEDWEMWVRISSNYPIGYIKDPLAAYRIHSKSSSTNKSITGENILDLLRVKTIFEKYLNDFEERREFEKSFKKIIYDISKSNYYISKSIKHKNANKHLLAMAKNNNNLKMAIKQYLIYLVVMLFKSNK
jgi:glycosyltransferase involved in cell wall biosynthesis